MSKISYLEFSGLLNRGVSDFSKPSNELSACKNVYEYEIGKLEKVPGYSLATSNQITSASPSKSPSVSSSASPSVSPSTGSVSPSTSPSVSVSPSVSPSEPDNRNVNYLFHYHDASADVDYLIAGGNSGTSYILKQRTTGTFSAISSGSWANRAGAEISMSTYLDKAFIVGYDNGTFLTNATLNGTTFSTADSDLTSMPQGKFVVRYRDLLYVLNAYTGSTRYPNRAYFCDEPTAGAITWTPSTDFLSFGQDDGDEITGGASALDRLIVFKHFSMWKYDESNLSKIADIGCDSYRSIINVNGVLYWGNRFGMWRWGGDLPQMISGKVQRFFDAADLTTISEWIGVQHEFEYRLFIGDVTVDGYTYNNTWICFDTRREKCYIRCTYDNVKSACTYTEAGKRRAYFGTDDGYVMKFATKVDLVYSDNDNEIDSFFITNNLDHGNAGVIKKSNHLVVFSKYAQGLKVSIDIDNEDSYSESLGEILKKNVEEIDFFSSAFRYRYKFYEKSSAKSWQFEGFIVTTDVKEEDI